ncbi:tetratricopeptide repeat protein [Salidesulfovibrio onnuriiensis]|uniref:tetratricopeptide repeat protein n=1 Tax=Salidesulfovibrio onnuriiensis TaxID=2583823 RepID=UPI0011C8735D|nr:tetratricopeptide repeat protein [Salidesulfovibrio onnuriiensis]
MVQEFPQILGVFSLRKEEEIGAGGTKKTHDNITYWYVRILTPEDFEVQPLNQYHVPSGIKSVIKKNSFLPQYTPEPAYYRMNTVPALESLARKVRKGQQAFENGELDEAERQFLKALMIDELNVAANMGLGKVYAEQQEFDKLKKVIDTLLSIDEVFVVEQRKRFNEFGISLRKNGMYDESIRYYNKALEFTNRDENLYFNLARVHYERGDQDGAIKSLKSALDLNPSFVEAQKFLKHCERLTA